MKATKESCRILRIDIEHALRLTQDMHGVTITVGSMSYDPQMGTISAKLNIACETENGQSASEASWKLGVAASNGRLTMEMLGQTFTMNNTEYTVAGFDHKRPKRCIQINRNSDGKRFVTNVDALRRALGLTPKNQWPFTVKP